MLTHICSQTHTLAASEGIQKNYAADNIFIQIYRSICLLHIMFMELGTHVFTVCSFGMRTVVNFFCLAAVIQITALGFLATSLIHQKMQTSI